MNTFSKTLANVSIGLLLLFGCWDDNTNIPKDSIDQYLNENYSLIRIDTSKNCLTDPIVCRYYNKHAKILATAGDFFLIDVEFPDKLQEQKLVLPCNLPETYFINGLDIYIDGLVERNPARIFRDDKGVLSEIDGQQRIFLTKLLVKK